MRQHTSACVSIRLSSTTSSCRAPPSRLPPPSYASAASYVCVCCLIRMPSRIPPPSYASAASYVCVCCLARIPREDAVEQRVTVARASRRSYVCVCCLIRMRMLPHTHTSRGRSRAACNCRAHTQRPTCQQAAATERRLCHGGRLQSATRGSTLKK